MGLGRCCDAAAHGSALRAPSRRRTCRWVARLGGRLESNPVVACPPASWEALINSHLRLSVYYQISVDCCSAATVSSPIIGYGLPTVHKLPRCGTERPGASDPSTAVICPQLRRRCGDAPGLHSPLFCIAPAEELPPWFLCTFYHASRRDVSTIARPSC